MNQDRQRAVGIAFGTLVFVLWLGFLVHTSPIFPRTRLGLGLGISGAGLMVLSAGYVLIKRIPRLKSAVSKHQLTTRLLSAHVFAGLIGAILAILHTGHKFHSPAGMWLTGSMLLLVLTGMIGRYLFSYSMRELREKRELLSKLQREFDRTAEEIHTHPDLLQALTEQGVWSRVFVFPLARPNRGLLDPLLSRAVLLCQAIADVDYSVKSHDALKRAFNRWLLAHISLSVAFLLLLGIHIWSGLYYGIR